MKVSVDVCYKSLNKYQEELCGDKVEILKTEDSDIIILADGMGSGVKANILATLTSKILGTMLLGGATIDECVETIVKTLPVCQVRKVAYSTFSILQIFKNKKAYLVEFDNPSCVFIRDGKIVKIPFVERLIENKVIKEYHFDVLLNDCFVLMSDGVIHAGVGKVLNFGWTWDSMAEYTLKSTKSTLSASRLASMLSKACDDLYMQIPGDDTTIAVARVIPVKEVHLFTGPPVNKDSDEKLVSQFMKGSAKKIVCGGTSANIIARVLDKEIRTSLIYTDPSLPPMAKIEGIDLVTEGVLTLSRTLSLLKTYLSNDIDYTFFQKLDLENGASKIAKVLIEECTNITLYVGKAMNEAHQNPNLPFDLSIRMNLVEQLKDTLKKMGKEVETFYF
ncbi:SpoIIE family protein phosphatase [Anaeromicropila herbilytica]|uniref:Serine/threonine phosphatase n=1 Tax=Anaeromicropila herbilytica TaxID=2785025 RepID=A0A7R7ID45_9FIRM|nr:SpoIIE family protein phosphatase [Anaeromicropila herbilytica]BCN31398.1 serine/threonine phosphatase [Anaeromicropila herbilytica]